MKSENIWLKWNSFDKVVELTKMSWEKKIYIFPLFIQLCLGSLVFIPNYLSWSNLDLNFNHGLFSFWVFGYREKKKNQTYDVVSFQIISRFLKN